MAMSNPYQSQQYQQHYQIEYQQQQVLTAPPDKLLLMLFDGALRFCGQAKKALEAGELAECHQFIIKTQDIIIELETSLNMDYEISASLFALYDYLYRRLVEANIKKDAAILEEVMDFLTDLRQMWVDVALQLRREKRRVVGGEPVE
jgi:flagellar protein FliS